MFNMFVVEKGRNIRWIQRFSNYRKALKKLSEAIAYVNNETGAVRPEFPDENANKAHDEIIKEGIIQRFEYTYEMAWNVMKDYAFYQGNPDISGSRDAIRFAFSSGLIRNGDLWMDMIKSRVMTSHTYDEKTANAIFKRIVNEFHRLFLDFEREMKEKANIN